MCISASITDDDTYVSTAPSRVVVVQEPRRQPTEAEERAAAIAAVEQAQRRDNSAVPVVTGIPVKDSST